MELKKILNDVAERLTVSKCPACRAVTRLSGTLCPDFLERYRAEKECECGFCKLPAAECVCSTRGLYYCRQLGRSMHSLIFYGSGNETFMSAMSSLKYSSDRGAEKFFARELSAALMKIMAQRGEFPEDWCVTFAPRRKSAVRKYGFDQSKGLARSVARYTGMGAAQKELGRDMRAENAEHSFMLGAKADVSGKKYVIVDDIITSGATLRTCQRILLSNGAAAAFAVSVAKTVTRGAGYDEKTRFKKRASDVWFRSR